MILVFGTSHQAQMLGMEVGTCSTCGATGYRDQQRHYRVAHFFFCPLFVTGEQVLARCSRCGRDERIAAPIGATKIPMLHRFGVVVPTVIVGVLMIVAGVQLLAKERAEAEATARRATARAAGERRLEKRLQRYQKELHVGSVKGLSEQAQRVADDAAPVLREQLELGAADVGLYVIIVRAPTGKRALLLTQVADQVDLSRVDLDAAAERIGEVVTTHFPPGSLVTWSIVQKRAYVASIGGTLGGRRFSQHDALLARRVAEDTLDYEGFGLKLQ